MDKTPQKTRGTYQTPSERFGCLYEAAVMVFIMVAVVFLALLLLPELAGCNLRQVPKREYVAIPWEVPITVGMHHDRSLGWERELDFAIKLWNDAAGCEVLRRVDPGDARVLVVHGGAAKKRDDGHVPLGTTIVANHPDDPRVVVGLVTMYNVPTSNLAYGVLVHELGHVLGVPDDRFAKASFMHYGMALDTDTMDLRLRRADKRAVALYYCGATI